MRKKRGWDCRGAEAPAIYKVRMETLGEEDQLRRAAAGDEAAFRGLFTRYTELLKARIRARLTPALRRKVDASDVLQDAYLVALQRIGEFRPEDQEAFGHWLGRIVEHKIRDTLRHYRADKRGVGAEVTRGHRPDTVNVAGREASPIEAAIASELEERARAALRLLPEDHREVIRLVQEHRLSFREAAGRMGRTEAAVKKLYERALARFGELLGAGP